MNKVSSVLPKHHIRVNLLSVLWLGLLLSNHLQSIAKKTGPYQAMWVVKGLRVKILLTDERILLYELLP